MFTSIATITRMWFLQTKLIPATNSRLYYNPSSISNAKWEMSIYLTVVNSPLRRKGKSNSVKGQIYRLTLAGYSNQT